MVRQHHSADRGLEVPWRGPRRRRPRRREERELRELRELRERLRDGHGPWRRSDDGRLEALGARPLVGHLAVRSGPDPAPGGFRGRRDDSLLAALALAHPSALCQSDRL